MIPIYGGRAIVGRTGMVVRLAADDPAGELCLTAHDLAALLLLLAPDAATARERVSDVARRGHRFIDEDAERGEEVPF